MSQYKSGGTPSSSGGIYPLDIMAPYESHWVVFSAFARKPVIFTNEGGTEGEKQQTVGGAVMLYIPEGISAEYSTNWNQKDLGIGGGAALQALNGSSRDAAIANLASSGAAGALLAQKGADALGQLAGTSTGVDLLNYGQRGVANSNPRLLFEGVGFRQFNFNYSFVPRNAEESKQVRNIIHYFKLYMHPTLSGSILNYPCEFNITYNGNEYLHNFKPCALTDMKVEYAVNGIWSSFQTTSAPTEVRMSLTFQETEFITRKDVEAEKV